MQVGSATIYMLIQIANQHYARQFWFYTCRDIYPYLHPIGISQTVNPSLDLFPKLRFINFHPSTWTINLRIMNDSSTSLIIKTAHLSIPPFCFPPTFPALSLVQLISTVLMNIVIFQTVFLYLTYFLLTNGCPHSCQKCLPKTDPSIFFTSFYHPHDTQVLHGHSANDPYKSDVQTPLNLSHILQQ